MHMIPLHPFCFISGVCSGCFSVTRGPSQSGAAWKAAWSAIVGEGAGRAKGARRWRPGRAAQRGNNAPMQCGLAARLAAAVPRVRDAPPVSPCAAAGWGGPRIRP